MGRLSQFRAEPEQIGDAEVLTQYGRDYSNGDQVFRSRPRYPREVELSMIRGRIGVEKATAYVRRGAPAGPSDRVRYTTAGVLRAAGFRVQHTPTARNPDHVSISVPLGHVEWDTEQELAFIGVFDETGGGEQHDGDD